MYIGEVAKITGLSIKAIRLYEERGLIIAPPRKGRYRVYSATHIELLNLIKEAKLLGSTLNQLKDVIVYKDGKVDWKLVGDFLENIKQELLKQARDIQIKINQVDACLKIINTS